MLNINEETHPELYSFPIEKSLEFASSLTDTSYVESEKIKFHFYWHIGKPFERKQSLPIKSFLATQNLEKCEINLWSNEDLSKNEYLKPYLHFINLKIYDPILESKNTVLDGCENILNITDSKCYLNGDLFRILILHNYGGVYVDMDMVLLRDLLPLLPYEFMYKWGGLPYNYGINGAIMRLFKKSKLCVDLLTELKHSEIMPDTFIWDNILYSKVRKYNKNWLVLPSAFFNSEWQEDLDLLWTTEKWNAFIDCNYKLYEGCFSWHWHNRYDFEIHPNSKWAKIENIINQKLRNRLSID